MGAFGAECSKKLMTMKAARHLITPQASSIDVDYHSVLGASCGCVCTLLAEAENLPRLWNP